MAAPETELPEPGGQMSFLEHLDELRKRIVRCVIFIVIAFFFCYFVSDRIYNFLSVPIRRALSEASRQQLNESGVQGDEQVRPLNELKEGDRGRFILTALLILARPLSALEPQSLQR